MRIVSVTHYFPSRKGGIEAVAFDINRRMAGRGHQVDWFASATPDLPEVIPGLRYQPVRAINIVEAAVGVPLPIWLTLDLRHLWSAIRDCDAVHVHDFIYQGSIVALIFGRILRKPVVITQHIGEIPYSSRVLRGLLKIVNRSVGRLALQQASQVVFISNSVEAYFRAFCHFRNPPRYVPNGVDINIYHPETGENRSQLRMGLGLSSDSPTCLFVGRFVEKKGLPMLKEIAAQTPEIQWLFAGQGPLHPTEWNLANVHVFEGWRGRRLAQLYRAADLLVLPSRGEGFPLVVQEAFACGTPALVSDETAAGCEAARPLLFELPVNNSNATWRWCQALSSLMAAADLLEERGMAAAEFSGVTWSWDAAVDAYCSIYEENQALCR